MPIFGLLLLSLPSGLGRCAAFLRSGLGRCADFLRHYKIHDLFSFMPSIWFPFLVVPLYSDVVGRWFCSFFYALLHPFRVAIWDSLDVGMDWFLFLCAVPLLSLSPVSSDFFAFRRFLDSDSSFRATPLFQSLLYGPLFVFRFSHCLSCFFPKRGRKKKSLNCPFMSRCVFLLCLFLFWAPAYFFAILVWCICSDVTFCLLLDGPMQRLGLLSRSRLFSSARDREQKEVRKQDGKDGAFRC